MKTKLFALIVLMLLPLGIAAQSNSVKARLKKYDFARLYGKGTSTDPFWYSVERDGKEGACDADGREIFPPRYDDVCRHGDGTSTKPFYYSVTRDGKEGAYDADGREIIPPRYDFVCRQGEGTSTDPFWYSVERDGKEGACDANGREIIPPKYDFVSRIGKGTSTNPFWYSVKRDGKEGACDANGREIIPPVYVSVIYHKDVFKAEINGEWVSLDIDLNANEMDNGIYKSTSGYGAERASSTKKESPKKQRENLAVEKRQLKEEVKQKRQLKKEMKQKVNPAVEKRRLTEEIYVCETKQNYKKALKLYNKLAKITTFNDDPTFMFMWGRCYYQNEKWKRAIRCFETVLSRKDEYTAEMLTSTRTLLASARKKREEQLQARAETWAMIGMAVAATAVSATGAIMQSRASGSTPSYSSSTNTSMAGDLNYLLDPRYTILQINAQDQREYQAMRTYNPNLTFEEFRYMKYSNMAGSNSSQSSETSSSSSSSSGSSRSSSSSRDFCITCANTKHCQQCHGSGMRTDNQFGTGTSSTAKCGICGGDGRCPKCR